MKIVIPMSGRGARFISAEYTDPKPLIKVNNKTIIEHVINLFPGEEDFIFVCRKEHFGTTKMKDVLLASKPNAKIVELEESSLGPVYAVSKAFNVIDDDEPVIINYCDFFKDWEYEDFKKTVTENKCDGAIAAYKGFHPHLLHEENLYASMRVDAKNYMTEIKEKYSFTPNKMDSPQSDGTFYFRTGRLMKRYFQKAMDNNISLRGEYYVSLVYNLLKEDGLNIYVYDKIPHFLQWGTPKDLEEYKYWSEIFEQWETLKKK